MASNDPAPGRGQRRTPVLKAIRKKCIDCSCGSLAEVRLCPVTKCALWPFRMGTNPGAKARGRSYAKAPVAPLNCPQFATVSKAETDSKEEAA